MSRDTNYALIELDDDGTLRARQVEEQPESLNREQLLGTTLRGTGSEPVTLEF